jgi:hypothetical protein
MYEGNANNHYIMYADLQKSRMRLENPTAKTINDVAEQSWEEILDYDADRYLQIYRFDLVVLEKDTTEERQLHFIRSILTMIRMTRRPLDLICIEPNCFVFHDLIQKTRGHFGSRTVTWVKTSRFLKRYGLCR